jgi:hypothetical protein
MFRTLAPIFALTMLFAIAPAAPAPPEGRARALWEYKVINELEVILLAPKPKDEAAIDERIKELRNLPAGELRKVVTNGLNVLGGEGWELVAVSAPEPNNGRHWQAIYHFKRTK